MCVNIMDVIFMGVCNVFPHNRETTMNNHRSIAQRWRDTQLKEKKIEKKMVILS